MRLLRAGGAIALQDLGLGAQAGRFLSPQLNANMRTCPITQLPNSQFCKKSICKLSLEYGFTNAQCPIPNAQFPMPNSQCPIPKITF
ncbi:MAG: hypothetical protein F6J93_35310 [Oscillatoria sp. SIO1A7]|nr:hypothetical protein [Oscillatoria sp. SIO1A7]